MKILHTSDWHLGRLLYGKQRYHEFEAFLDWLVDTLERHDVDTLLIAGDIFDTSTPSHRAQSLYYRFLYKVAASCCRHVVLIAGNHDSASFLNAPQALLRTFNVYVVGNATQDPADEVLVLCDQQQQAQLIVCAVPYLRDYDLRLAQAGESFEDKERKLTEGIRNHYAAATAIAEQRRRELGGRVPIIAMGHLFTAGGETIEDDGVRALYVGSLAHVSARVFSRSLDYVALGHLHVPQAVDDCAWIRYSGSPLAIGFGEADQLRRSRSAKERMPYYS